MTNPRRTYLGSAKRIVVKLGSSLLAPEGIAVRAERLAALAAQVAELRRGGREVILVSSGAIASGMRRLGLVRRPPSVAVQQALAAIGQPELMRAYAEAFAAHGLIVGQVLLTLDVIHRRSRFVNARNAFMALLARGAVPVVNENDTVAVDELRIGDNDSLSAHVVLLTGADALIILTDVDGLYRGRPGAPGAERVDVVEAITPQVRRWADAAAGSAVGSGGMRTKLEAAHIVTLAGHAVLVARGTDARVLLRAVAGESVGTLFLPATRRMSARKRWLAFAAQPGGAVIVDAGARRALVEGGKSLLPRGVVGVAGEFERDEAVSLRGPDGEEFGRGLAAYSSAEVDRIKGRPARDIVGILGFTRGDEVVHRDRMVLL